MTPEDRQDYEAMQRLREKYGASIPAPADLYWVPAPGRGYFPGFVVLGDTGVYSLTPVPPPPGSEGAALNAGIMYMDYELAAELHMDGARAFCVKYGIEPART